MGVEQIMELKDTVDLMLSDDFKDRLKAEYYQLTYRIEKLEEYIDEKIKNEKLTGDETLEMAETGQLFSMETYRNCLENRCKDLGIVL